MKENVKMVNFSKKRSKILQLLVNEIKKNYLINFEL